MGSTKIEWADAVWNPVTGCTKVSAGCANCYAERLVKWLGGKIHAHGAPTIDGDSTDDAPFSEVVLHPDKLDQPLHWRKPRRVFVCSMGDLFHEDVPDEFIREVVVTPSVCAQHTFMILTKRPQRMLRFFLDRYGNRTVLPRNVWLGVSVENQAAADERIPLLLKTPAAVRFVSVEPMIGPVDLRHVDFPDLSMVHARSAFDALAGGGTATKTPWKIDWVICGGESGPGARPMHPEWARSLRDQCVGAGVPFFFKQWGEWAPGVPSDDVWCRRIYDWPDGVTSACRVGKKAAGRLLDGREWSEFPR